MSQPNNRSGIVPQPGKLDPSLGEFWSENPWQIVSKGHNLSCYERNRIYLNLQGKHFLDVSHLSAADSDGDGRAAVAADFRNVGMMDLIVRQAGGGALLYYENRLPNRHYLTVSLRGTESNREGIGARLTATVGGRTLVRELYPANTYYGQGPALVHFGLGDETTVTSLKVRWPSGKEQEVKAVAGDRHVLIEEGGAVEAVVPGKARN